MKKRRTKLNNKGMTLVETVVAISIISIASLMLATGFLSAATVIKRGTIIAKASAQLGAQVEQASYTLENAEPGSVTLTLEDGTKLTLGGSYVVGRNEEQHIKYSVFVSE